MADEDPVPEASASEAETTAEASRRPDQAGPAIGGESATGSDQSTATSAVDSPAAPSHRSTPSPRSDSAPPPTELKLGHIVVGAIGVFGLLLSLIWLIASPPISRVGTAGLVAIFLISASAVVGALKPYWEHWKPASRIGVAVSAAAGAHASVANASPNSSWWQIFKWGFNLRRHQEHIKLTEPNPLRKHRLQAQRLHRPHSATG
jgi:hypothetical protein